MFPCLVEKGNKLSDPLGDRREFSSCSCSALLDPQSCLRLCLESGRGAPCVADEMLARGTMIKVPVACPTRKAEQKIENAGD